MVKSIEQVDFVGIVDRLKATGLNQSDVARELKITRSAVTMILNGKRQPGPGTMFMLKDLERRMGVAVAADARQTKSQAELDELIDTLTQLKSKDRAAFAVAKQMIDTLWPVSSREPSAAKRLLRKAAAVGPKSGPK